MKKAGRIALCSVLSALLLLTFAMPALGASNTVNQGGVIYELNGNEIKVVGYDQNNPPVNVVISGKALLSPDAANVTVTIQNGAFRGNTKLETFKVNSSIGEGDAITEVRIGASAFEGCTSLTTVDIRKQPAPTGPEKTGITVAEWGNSAFKDCTALSGFQDGLTLGTSSIPSNLFYNCSALSLGEIDGVTTVGVSAFYGCTTMTEVSLPKVTSIGNQAFAGCAKLKTVNAPELKTVGPSAFKDCVVLKSVATAKLTAIGDAAFARTRITSLADLNDLTDIGNNAFFACESLTRVDLSSSVNLRTIGNGAFASCGELENVVLPSNALVSIGSRVFEGTKLDPAQTGGVYNAAPLCYAGTETQWNRVHGSDPYTKSYKMEFRGVDNTAPTDPGSSSTVPTPEPTPTPGTVFDPSVTFDPSTLPNPMPLEDDWVWFEDPNLKDKPETTERENELKAPKYGEEFYLRAYAKRGSVSFTIDVDSPHTTSYDLGQKKVFLDSSKPGLGDGMSACQVPVKLYGKPGDEFTFKLTGVYTFGGQNYPISKTLTLTMHGSLEITGVPANVIVNDTVTLQAQWGPPPTGASYEWKITGPESSTQTTTGTNTPYIWTPTETGTYVVECVGIAGSVGLKETKKIKVKVIGVMTPGIDDAGQLANMQPGDTTSLRIKWPNGTPNAERITYSWTCKPDQAALSSGIHAQAITFMPQNPGTYTITCIVTVQEKASEPSTAKTYTATLNDVTVQKQSLTISDGSTAPAEGTSASVPVLSSGDKKNLTATWAPVIDTAQNEDATYTWSCTNNGVNVTAEAFRTTPTGNTADFQPMSAGDYVVRCTSVRKIGKNGREVKQTALYRCRVGLSVSLTAKQGSSDVPDGGQIQKGQKDQTGQPVTVTAKVEPSLGTDQVLKWTISGAKWDNADAASDGKTTSLTFTPTSTGTVTVTCSAGSGAAASKATMKFTVVENVLQFYVNDDAKPVEGKDWSGDVENAVAIRAEMKPAKGSNQEYVWTPVAGATFTWENDTATLAATKTGAYLVTCQVKEKNASGSATTVASATLRVVLRRETAASSSSKPALSIIGSAPASQNGVYKLAAGTKMTFTAALQNVSEDPKSIEWTAVRTHDGDGNKVPEADRETETLDAKPDSSVLEVAAGTTLKEAGIYELTCTAGMGQTDPLTKTVKIEIYTNPRLEISRDRNKNKTDENATKIAWSKEGYIKVKQGDTVSLGAGWSPALASGYDDVWYTWTCTNSATGNVADSSEPNSTFTVNRANGSNTAELRIPPKTDEDGQPVYGETYKVTCTAGGSDVPTKVPSQKTADLVFLVVDVEDPLENDEDGNPDLPGSEDSEHKPATQMEEYLVDNPLVALSANAKRNAVRVTGLNATGGNHEGWTVADVLASFESHSGMTVVVTDSNGNTRSDLDARIVTGDIVQLYDADRNAIEGAAVVLMGDMLGTGELDLSQLVAIAKAMKNSEAFTGPYMEAGDWDENGSINLSDIVMQAGELKKAKSVSVA